MNCLSINMHVINATIKVAYNRTSIKETPTWLFECCLHLIIWFKFIYHIKINNNYNKLFIIQILNYFFIFIIIKWYKRLNYICADIINCIYVNNYCENIISNHFLIILTILRMLKIVNCSPYCAVWFMPDCSLRCPSVSMLVWHRTL